jgi:uncharacterized protein (TIGR00251 family)
MEEFRFNIRVRANASKNYVGGNLEDRLIVRVQAPPEDGKANQAVVKVLAKAFNVRQREVEVISGDTFRDKRILIVGDIDKLSAKYEQLLGN